MNKTSQEIVSRGHIAFVQATWHKDIVDQLRDSFKLEFSALSDKQMSFFEVPGAYEIPIFAKALAETEKYAAVVAAGLVVDGGIYRHEFVASAVIDNLMRVQMDTAMPVFSAVLTPQNFDAGEDQTAFFKEHFIMKGQEVAQACAKTLAALSKIG